MSIVIIKEYCVKNVRWAVLVVYLIMNAQVVNNIIHYILYINNVNYVILMINVLVVI